MKICVTILLLFGVVCGKVYAQQGEYVTWFNRAEKLFRLDNPTSSSDSTASDLYAKAFQPALEKSNGAIALESLIKRATIKQTYGQYDDAIDLYQKSLQLNNRYFRDSSRLYYASLYIGTAYYQQGVTDSAKYYFEQASAISLNDMYESRFPEQERLYNSLGAIYYEIANYQQAINYFEKAKQYANGDKETLATLESNIANCLVQLNQYGEALKRFRSLLNEKNLQRSLYHNTGHAYFKLNNHDSALYFLNKVSRENDWTTVITMNDLGRIYASVRQFAKSKSMLDSSLKICNVLAKESRNRDRALNYINRAILADSLHNSSEAIIWCNKAIDELYVRYPQDEASSPTDETRCLSPVIVLQALKIKAAVLEDSYASSQDVKYLRDCFNAHLKAMHVAGYIRRWLDNDEAKMFFQDDHSAIYHNAMRVCYMLWQVNDRLVTQQSIITILEEYKGNILYESIREAFSKSTLKVPGQSREKELKESLSYYTIQLGHTTSDKDANELRKKILNVQVQLSRLRRQFEERHAYDFLKEERNIDSFTKQLIDFTSHTAAINFMTTKDAVYGFVMVGRRFELKKMSVDKSFLASFKNFVSEVYDHREGKRYEGQNDGHLLYERLLQPFSLILDDYNSWVIMADGFLNYIPFESLTLNGNKRDYLLFHHTITYHYSFSLLMNHHQKLNMTPGVLFFAPFSKVDEQTASLPSLPFSKDEVPVTGIKKYTGAAATKQAFLSQISNAGIIHLATHAVSKEGDDAGTMIYFFPAKNTDAENNIHLNEVYSLPLSNTRLVVLSACETASGANVSGEGLLSLSRAFMYAGSEGIISTLWKTEDKVTAKLMQYFYEELNAGYNIEQSLQKAKVRFLQDESISEKYKTPNYWSNFIYIGSISTARTTSMRFNLVVTILACILVLVAIRIITKRKSYPANRG